MAESDGSNLDTNTGESGTAGFNNAYADPKHPGGYRSGPAPGACGTCSQPSSRH